MHTVQTNNATYSLNPELDSPPGNPCLVCGTLDRDKPTCFTGERYCCEDHRKAIIKLINE